MRRIVHMSHILYGGVKCVGLHQRRFYNGLEYSWYGVWRAEWNSHKNMIELGGACRFVYKDTNVLISDTGHTKISCPDNSSS